MLFVTRRTGEAVLIGDGISILVVELKAGHVRLGIRAPREVPVLREEIAQRIAQTPEVRSRKKVRRGGVDDG